MLALDAILKATRQMTAYGETYPRHNRRKTTLLTSDDNTVADEDTVASHGLVRRWDDELMVYAWVDAEKE